MDTVQAIELITTNPKVRGGRPCIAGTGLRVTDVVIAHNFHNQSPDEISVNYAVSLSSVYAALAYYYEHKTDLDKDMRAQFAEARQLKEQYGGDSLLPG